jgi:hypothetical protein
MEMVKEKKEKKVEPIYEKLAPGEVLIISKEGNCVTYATNEGGKLILRKACVLPGE